MVNAIVDSSVLVNWKGFPGNKGSHTTRFNWTCLCTLLSLWVFFIGVSTTLAQLRGVIIEGKNPAQFVKSQGGKAWAVVVGINAYQHAPHLSYAVADAQSMADLLRTQGFSVVSFYDEQATRKAILSELGDRLPTIIEESDRVVIFFAGHGETRQFGRASTMGYLLPVEAHQTSLSATAIDMGVIRTLAQALPAKQVLFLIDVCYGGIAGQRFRSLSPITAEYMKVITRERGRQLITAGGSDQQAIESPEWGHSAFTYFLLKGIGNGLADLNDDGIIPASELYTYLDQRVYAAAQLIGHVQRPELWRLSAEQGEFVFFPPPSPRKARESRTRDAMGEVSEPAQDPSDVAALRKELEALQNQVHALLHSKSPALPPPTSPTRDEPIEDTSKETSAQNPSPEVLCEKGQGVVCFRLASQYILGKNAPVDLTEGAKWFEKGCRKGHLNSCTALGNLLWLGHGVKQDKTLAVDIWKFACKKGNVKACTLLDAYHGAVG